MSGPWPSPRYAPWLGALAAAFALRVAGQLVVAVAPVSWLPPMRTWYSGLIPYPVLLPLQMLVLALLVWIASDFARGAGFFVRPRRAFALGAWVFGWLYLGSMVVRYAVTMARHPEARWFGSSIPIAFHIVLASFVLVFASYHRRALSQSQLGEAA